MISSCFEVIVKVISSSCDALVIVISSCCDVKVIKTLNFGEVRTSTSEQSALNFVGSEFNLGGKGFELCWV